MVDDADRDVAAYAPSPIIAIITIPIIVMIEPFKIVHETKPLSNFFGNYR